MNLPWLSRGTPLSGLRVLSTSRTQSSKQLVVVGSPSSGRRQWWLSDFNLLFTSQIPSSADSIFAGARFPSGSSHQ